MLERLFIFKCVEADESESLISTLPKVIHNKLLQSNDYLRLPNPEAVY